MSKGTMPKIGVVLSGCAGKGAYEVGCLHAIVEYFGKENIKCVSSASMGAFVGQCYGMDQYEELDQAFREMDSGKYGRYILGFSGNKDAKEVIRRLLSSGKPLFYEHYVSIWNVTRSTVEYIPFHTLKEEELLPYMQGALAVPVFSKGVVIGEERMFDGAFLDNIPISPLLEKDLDYIFCVYFDNHKYVFESEEFNRKVIKLFDFPNKDRLEALFYEPNSYERMRNYGYEYATQVIRKIFAGETREEILEAIALHDEFKDAVYKPRLTVDVVLDNLNVMTRQYFKSSLSRKKEKV